jgi:hypothetical protein
MSKTPLPAAVQRQDEAADQIVQEVYAPTADPPPAPPAAEPPAEPVAPAPAPQAENWQQKFLTLQGKYNAEVPRLNAEVRRLTDELKALQTSPPAPAAPAAAPEPPATLVTDKDVSEFGADLVDLIRRAAREESGPERTRLMAEIESLKAQLPDLTSKVTEATAVAADTARNKYFADLGALVPDYEAVNVDEAFIGWLSMADPMTGQPRNDLLQSAFNTFDHKRTAVIFNAYKQETGKTAPAPEPVPAPTSGLEREVSPATSRSPSLPASIDEKVWTGAEVQEVYAAISRGDYRTDPAEAQRLDKAIDKALSEGRVRG